jgi:heme a synthase
VTIDGQIVAIGDFFRRSRRSLRNFAWVTLVCNVAVILWGAYVRLSGSGAGCGNKWPLCEGAVLPHPQHIQTLIEFTHRATSGIALLSVLCLWLWTRLAMPRRHPARYTAFAGALLVLNEALLGASLVLLGHVAGDASVARAIWLSLHSTNTMFLLAAIALTQFWVWKPSSAILPWSARYALPTLTLVLLLIVGVTGSVTALGDTLFPASSLTSALAQDFASNSPYLLRLRFLHPAMALLSAISMTWIVVTARRSRNKSLRILGAVACVVFSLQLTLGVLNLVLLTPAWLQILHLLVADVLWITIVLLAAELLTAAGTARTTAPSFDDCAPSEIWLAGNAANVRRESRLKASWRRRL